MFRHEPITNTCSCTTHRNLLRTWYTLTLIICTDGQCINRCLTPNFDGSTTSQILTLAIALDSSTGYILEVDLEYQQSIHDEHIDLPFCPTRDKPPGKRQNKLLASLYDKKHCVIHYRNLQQYTRHGLRVTKVHRVLQFAQFAWLRNYIELKYKF